MTRDGRTIELYTVLAEGWTRWEVRRDSRGATYVESEHVDQTSARVGLQDAVALFRLSGWEWSASS